MNAARKDSGPLKHLNDWRHTMKIPTRNIFATAFAAALAAATQQATADSTTEVTAHALTTPASVVVDVADLNLNTPEGQAAFLYRVSNAAEQVCGARDARSAGGVAQAARNADCYQASRDRALSSIAPATVASVN
jgi:UrcA family protein